MRILHSSDPVKVEKLFNGSDPDLWRRGPVGLNHQQRSIFNGELKPIELHEEPTELTGRIQAPGWRSLHGAGPAHADLAAQAGPSDLVAQDRSDGTEPPSPPRSSTTFRFTFQASDLVLFGGVLLEALGGSSIQRVLSILSARLGRSRGVEIISG
uniref:Uncharacterized protein n=1 Tax=Fagus sylvatica TaxID=28930 RepID=A0A2N9FLG4_FAGSY